MARPFTSRARLQYQPAVRERHVMTVQTKWTPGPWHAESRDDGVTIGKDSRLIVVVGCDEIDEAGDGEVMSREQKANARLIAAAPDLAKALRALLDATVTVSGPKRRPIITAREDAHPVGVGEAALDALAALAKAEGK